MRRCGSWRNWPTAAAAGWTRAPRTMKRQSGGTCRADALPLPLALGRHFLALCSGFPLRLVDAMFLSSFSLIDSSIDFDAPLSFLFGVRSEEHTSEFQSLMRIS